MLESFSRTGFPKEIITDQWGVFMGKLMKYLCKLLDIQGLKTSPYHLQTNGALKRWHGTSLGSVRIKRLGQRIEVSSVCV